MPPSASLEADFLSRRQDREVTRVRIRRSAWWLGDRWYSRWERRARTIVISRSWYPWIARASCSWATRRIPPRERSSVDTCERYMCFLDTCTTCRDFPRVFSREEDKRDKWVDNEVVDFVRRGFPSETLDRGPRNERSVCRREENRRPRSRSREEKSVFVSRIKLRWVGKEV